MTLVPWLLLVGIKPFTGLHGFVPGLGLQNRARRTIPIVPFGGSGVGCLRLGGPLFEGLGRGSDLRRRPANCHWVSVGFKCKVSISQVFPKTQMRTAKPGTPNLHNLQL